MFSFLMLRFVGLIQPWHQRVVLILNKMLGDGGLVMIIPLPVTFYGCASELKSTLKVD